MKSTHNYKKIWQQTIQLSIFFSIFIGAHSKTEASALGLAESTAGRVGPDSKIHGAKMGPTWVLSTPDGPHVGPMNLAIRGTPSSTSLYTSIHDEAVGVTDMFL